jgi:hypothetical protein
MLKISIPTPCNEDWNKMTPDQTGRHCSSCAKSVVDFTSMTDDEVKYFFINKKEDDRVCGRFKQTQLQRIVIELPQNIFSIQMPLWKKFLAACLVVFSTTLFSCETKMQGAVDMPVVKMEKTTQTDETGYVGMLHITYDSVSVPIVCQPTIGITIPELVPDNSLVELQGDINIVEVDSTWVIQTDTIPVPKQKEEVIFMGDSIYEELPIKKAKADSASKTKNRPKADSINCNTIKNYY